MIALEIICGFMAAALVLFALLAWRISPIVFALMRAQAGYAETWNELLTAVEDAGLSKLESRDLKQLKERVKKLENAQAVTTTTRSRRKVTA